MDKQELLGKELSNLYAINKQVNHYFKNNDLSFLDEHRQQTVNNYIDANLKNEELVTKMLRSLEVNPGNTVDSIVNEITENLHEISLKITDNKALNGLGYMMSFNRLLSYHKANVVNIDFILNELNLS
ncbi:MAG: hypothetical protein ABJO28_10385 [Maribacter dokdonensis]|uniref:hypothetical protein n=1 Tax=Maribacter dokdonensis TaxID=320912 RepID=UPI001C088B9F|nr:hypothetical protein [Maribacter dokdonensis]MBU2899953.1 hypothetical protein [Maribacter dokdonensis]